MKSNFHPLLPFVILNVFALAETPGIAGDSRELDLWTGRGVGLGDFFFPQVNYQAALGSASTNPANLAVGHHDPDRHGITQQNIEFSLAARFAENATAFATYAAKVDLDDRLADEFEEYYVVLGGLPLDARLKGGRFYPRIGYQQELHPHDFVFVDQHLGNGRFVGEDSLALYGAQLTLPVLRSLPAGWDDRLSVAYGAVPVAEEEAHEHGGEEAKFEGEGALFADWAATVDYTLGFTATSRTRYELGGSFAFGRNGFDRHTQLYGLHLETVWRPDGVLRAAHGWDDAEFLRWRSEVFARQFDAGSEDFSDGGFYTALSYGFSGGKVQAHLRGEYVSGVAEAGLPERWRVSPALSWRPSENLPFHFKLQYNYDHSPSFGEEHSVWAQFSLTWGDHRAHAH